MALASFICQTPIAAVTLVDSTRQWFKAKTGTSLDGSSRKDAFCAHAILNGDLLEIPDASTDTRFADNPLVQNDPHIRFYAGMPLVTNDGFALGSVCVIDRQPRQLTAAQKSALAQLARLTMSNLEFRRVAAQLADAIANVKTLSGMLPICAWCKEVRNDAGYWQQVEFYLTEHTDAKFSHGICPKCQAKMKAEIRQGSSNG